MALASALSPVEVVEQFKQLVPIANPSNGEAEIRAYIQAQLSACGITEQVVDDAGNLLVRVPGQDAGQHPVLLSAHLDSVPPCHGIVPVSDAHSQDGRPIIRSEGKTILGADDKAGIATILTLARQLAAEQFSQNVPLEFLFSTGEEVGLTGAKAFDMTQLRSPYAYVLDGEGSVGDIFYGGPAQENLQLNFHGKAAHAGMAPETGINAIQLAADVVAQMPVGRLSPITTTNLGTIEGGAALNIVPERVSIRGEARSHDEAELLSVLESYTTICQDVEAQYPGSHIEFVHLRRYQAFSVSEEAAVVKRAQQACAALGIASSTKRMSIGSDAHILNLKGLPTIVLGMGFHFSHSLGEFIYADELAQVFQWVLHIIRPENRVQ